MESTIKGKILVILPGSSRNYMSLIFQERNGGLVFAKISPDSEEGNTLRLTITRMRHARLCGSFDLRGEHLRLVVFFYFKGTIRQENRFNRKVLVNPGLSVIF